MEKQCEQCGEVFEYTPNPAFPRKYCSPCSAAKKASYQAKQGATVAVTQPNTPTPRADFAPTPVFKSEPSRDHSIVAQVFTKCANEQLVETINKFGSEELEGFDARLFLVEAIGELHGAYKHALSLLE